MSDKSETAAADLSYRDAMDELDAIVAEMDEGTVDIDTLAQRFQRAVDIVENLDQRINKTKEQVDRLVPKLEQLRSDNPA